MLPTGLQWPGVMSGTRRTVAVACIALVVFAALLPLGGLSLEWLVVTPAFTLLPPFTTPVVPLEALQRNERSIALLVVLESRGPPTPSSFA